MDSQHPSGGFGTNLPAFFVLSWLHMLWLTRVYIAAGASAPGVDFTTLFYGATWLLYACIYLGPALLLTLLARALAGRYRHTAASITAFITATLTLLLVRADSLVYDLYAFHINSFVLNLLVTPGGIASLGAGQESIASTILMVCQIVGIQGLIFSVRIPHLHLRAVHARSAAAVLVGCFLVQGFIYGASDVGNYGPVLDGSKAFPFFQRVRFRRLAQRFGFEHAHRQEFSVAPDTDIRYPLQDVPFAAVASPPNVILLVAESLRWDQLNAETMPNTWAFSEHSQRFDNHYSSGNGTREGLFGMFYGLYGSYWESFMTAQRPPLLMRRMQELDYDFDVRTSATFTYPEFDKTLFTGLPAQLMHTADGALPSWERDVKNTDELLAFIEQQPANKPFFEFFFFESTHAPYSFPEDKARFPDFGPEMDYASLSKASLAENIQPLYTRYRNSAHWVDVQLGRIYAQLEQQGLLDNTIVIVTGDHGEEFMEKGAWGHNSSFVEEQTHVPFVLAMPRGTAAVVRHPTSHLDVATTLLHTLGARGDPANYTLGISLHDPSPQRHLVVSDWHSIGILTPELKYRIPYVNLSGIDYWTPTDATDAPLTATEANTVIDRYRDLILATMLNCTKFGSG
jgi:membrane-anchored protein YejM (alkaline phosphatase superfamily)